MQSLDVRLAVAEDDAGIVAIYNCHELEMLPLTLAHYRMEHAEEHGDHRSERYVAAMGGRIAGYGRFQWAWWTGQQGIYAMELRVDPRWARQGIGTELFASMRTQLLARGANRLIGWIRADPAAGKNWAMRSGFTPTEQVIQEYHLSIAEADISAWKAYEARLRGEGIRIVSLAALGRTDEGFLRALQQLWLDPEEVHPDPDRCRESFEAWQEQALHAPGLSPATHWIALESGRPVGTTFLRQTRERAYENDYTGVAPTHRRRGIATALKLRAILWAQQQQVEWFYTSSEIGNSAMITIHTRLGYRPGILRREFACDLRA